MVSVILPVYNEAEIIERTIQSLVAQRLDPGFELEILIIDGCSTDGSPQIVGQISRLDSRIRLLDNPWRKASFAFNIGLREARGHYVGIFGAHCVYAPDYIKV